MKFGNMSAEQMIAAADVTEVERAELRELLGGVYAATGIAKSVAEQRFAARVQQIVRGRSGRGGRSLPSGRSAIDTKVAKKARKRARRAAEASALGIPLEAYLAQRKAAKAARDGAGAAATSAFRTPAMRYLIADPAGALSLEQARRRAGTNGLRLSTDPRWPGAVVDANDNVVQMPPRRDGGA